MYPARLTVAKAATVAANNYSIINVRLLKNESFLTAALLFARVLWQVKLNKLKNKNACDYIQKPQAFSDLRLFFGHFFFNTGESKYDLIV